MSSASSKTLRANCAAFSRRFPGLSALIGLDCEEGIADLERRVPADYSLVETSSGAMSLSVAGALLHSRYDPERDAERELATLESRDVASGCVFAGIGLAYLPERYAAAHPDSAVIIVEPDLFILVLTLSARPLDALFAHANLAILAGIEAREAASFLEKTGNEGLFVHEPPALSRANRPWFDEFTAIRRRNREKKEINANTLRRFGDLWLANMCKNLPELRDRPGIAGFGDTFADVPALVLAAGPSLDRVLPRLAALREKCVVIAVDTAVRACVRAGVEPDFIVLVDPQYWNWRHLDGLSCPASVLITESAAWPAVFRFKTRATCLCSSLFPLGKFLEARTATRGELGAGGSVSTTAWDFARHLGCPRIVMAGLDLGFPDRKTHFTGSIFEERAHVASTRLATAETAGYHALYGAGPYPVEDYRGRPVLTDKRLILYAWWFEARIAANPDRETSTLTPEGVRIPGFSTIEADEIALWPDVRPTIGNRIDRALSRTESPDPARFAGAVEDLERALADIARLAREGIAECDEWIAPGGNGSTKDRLKLLDRLDRIDRSILGHPAKEVAAMVFSDATESGDDRSANDDPINASRNLYGRLLEAAEKNVRMLRKFA